MKSAAFLLMVCALLMLSASLRMRRAERVTLELLSDGAEHYGLQLVANSRGAITRGRVYVILDRLEGRGVVMSRALPSGQRLYRIAQQKKQETDSR